MDGLSRRAFCSLVGASAGALSGCTVAGDRSLSGGGETIEATTTLELERAFAHLEPGDTVHISPENAPYRTVEWLDIDTDGVTVVGPGLPGLIQPANGASVGGIRIGHHGRCENVTVRGVGYDGNPKGQPSGATRLHGIVVADAENVTLESNHIRRTHPTSHGDGGSGISVRHPCTNVVVRDNRIEEFGDRGVQVAGTGVLVGGNVVTDGLDRPVACDVWEPGRQAHAATRIVVQGNLLGNTVEGSLVGIASNSWGDAGFVSVVGNVGFGAHKSFCHLRGSGTVENVSIQHNVSRQEATGLETDVTAFSGVTIDPAVARSVTVANNEFWGYRGHGVRVSGDVEGIVIRHNRLANPARSGVRLEGVSHSLVDGNVVTEPGESGVRLERTANVAVRGNFVHGAASGAVVEEDDTRANWITGNVADGDTPWQLASPTTRAQHNRPRSGVFRGVTAGADGVANLSFARPYAHPPRLTFGRRGGGVRAVTYETDADGNVVGADIEVARPGSTLDVFVD
jgi:hypothetical protein